MHSMFFSVPSPGTSVQRAALVNFNLAVNAYQKNGVRWLRRCRQLSDFIATEYGLNVYIAKGAGELLDIVDQVYAEFPLMIGLTLSIVFALMALAFASLAVPLRLVGTIVVTLAFSYGLTVLTYQHGVLDFLGTDSMANSGGINWLPPIMCFTIIVGLALDYDVFLVSRVLEYRLNGYTPDGSILKGVYKTGHVITNAGIIMAVAVSDQYQ